MVNCIFCGLHVDPEVAVRYQGWISHPECAKSAMNQRIESFNQTHFILAVFGAVIGLVFTSLLSGAYVGFSEPIVPNYIFITNLIGIGYVGISVGFLIHSIGLFSLHRTYGETYARLSAIMSVLVASCFGCIALLLLTFGLDPLYHDPETGHLLQIPYYFIVHSASVALFAVLSVLVAITVWMLEDELRGRFVPPRILGILLVIVAALVGYTLPMIALYFVIVLLIFTTAGIPKYWVEIEK